MYYFIFLLLLVLFIKIKSIRSVGIIRSSHLTPTFISQPLDSFQQHQYLLKYILTNLGHSSFTITFLCFALAHSSWRDSSFDSQNFLKIHPILQHSLKCGHSIYPSCYIFITGTNEALQKDSWFRHLLHRQLRQSGSLYRQLRETATFRAWLI